MDIFFRVRLFSDRICWVILRFTGKPNLGCRSAAYSVGPPRYVFTNSRRRGSTFETLLPVRRFGGPDLLPSERLKAKGRMEPPPWKKKSPLKEVAGAKGGRERQERQRRCG